MPHQASSQKIERRIGVITTQLISDGDSHQQQSMMMTTTTTMDEHSVSCCSINQNPTSAQSFFPDYRQEFLKSMSSSNNNNSPTNGWFSNVQAAPADPILGLTTAFKADPSPKKVNLGVGAYRTEHGTPYVLPVVRKAERIIANDETLNKEYIPQDGLAEFNEASAKLLFGEDSPVIREGRNCTIQSLSGTGGLRVAFEFIAKFLSKGTKVWVSQPTWGNHFNVIAAAGLESAKYRYLNKDMSLAFDSLMQDLETANAGDVVLLHLCAHNPTGVDPTHDQWKQIGDLVRRKNLLPFFDSAYQGFASGDLDKDAWAARYFAHDLGLEFICTQSYAKNFGLYGERIGALNFVCKTAQQAKNVRTQLMILVRVMYSSPQLHGARIVAFTLQSPELTAEWKRELVKMSSRINDMRKALYNAIKKRNIPGSFQCILNQIGMFSMIPLTPQQCEAMIKKHHIYMTSNGRISMAGLNTSNVDYVANAIGDVISNF